MIHINKEKKMQTENQENTFKRTGMIKTILFLSFILFLNIIFSCCAGKSGRSARPFSTVEVLPKTKNYVLNNPVTFRVKTKLRKGELKSVSLFLNEKLLTTSVQQDFSYDLPSLDMTGINTFRVVAQTMDDITGTRIGNFTVLSDIQPVKYDFSVIRQLSHSTEHFTQGLEIHNGFLYEGTGEYGKSGLFKKNISNSKILISKYLEPQYFGEGITVLDNKIYQLTYKNKVGFVYNLSDFSLVDSFRIVSAEGWGLTNNGKHLIMSDGTGTLTWIDPGDFSVIKKVQVADHQKVFQYLNELEYDHENIWANVWTSGHILRIDAETGKIKGYIDLSGILNTLPGIQRENIDVMNGIALMPDNGHLLITGKYWPKMFEIKVNLSEESRR
jgi:glutaminyl-peptide cyclotransferase